MSNELQKIIKEIEHDYCQDQTIVYHINCNPDDEELDPDCYGLSSHS